MPRAKAAALRALALDPTLSEVHTSLAILAMFLDRNWPEAEQRLIRAIELNPSNAQAHLFRAWDLTFTGHSAEGFAELLKARTLDPLSLIINTRVGTMLHYMGRDREAISAFQRALEIDSTFAQARAGLALSFAMDGRYPEALGIHFPVEPMLGNDEGGEKGFVLAKAARREEARAALAELEAYRKTRYVAADALAAIYTALGENESAFPELDRALRERSFTLVICSVEPMFAPLHRDPRWTKLVARMGLERR